MTSYVKPVGDADRALAEAGHFGVELAEESASVGSVSWSSPEFTPLLRRLPGGSLDRYAIGVQKRRRTLPTPERASGRKRLRGLVLRFGWEAVIRPTSRAARPPSPFRLRDVGGISSCRRAIPSQFAEERARPDASESGWLRRQRFEPRNAGPEAKESKSTVTDCRARHRRRAVDLLRVSVPHRSGIRDRAMGRRSPPDRPQLAAAGPAVPVRRSPRISRGKARSDLRQMPRHVRPDEAVPSGNIERASSG